MKTLKSSLWVALVTGLAVSTVMLLTRSPRTLITDANEATKANEQSQRAEQNEPVVHQPALAATTAVGRQASAVPITPHKTDMPATDIASQTANMVRVRADGVLARVNNQAIQLKDLVPLRADEQEHAMTAEEYESRLNRAIEMELTFQAAAVQGVDLTPEQKQRVGGLGQKHKATLRAYQLQGITWSSVTPSQLEFEQRYTSALLLQQNLVAMEAGAAPSSEPGVQARYEQARSEVLSRLKATSHVSF